MPSSSFSLLDTRSLSSRDILNLFEQANRFEQLDTAHDSLSSRDVDSRRRVVACLFFEASTRTRMSFQMAAYRMGHEVLLLESNSSSSLSKGETLGDTVLNVVAMKPDVLVVRYGNSEELDQLLPTLPIPVLSAGTGVSSHPSQALLDAYTIHREFGSVAGKKILIVGDIKHSRVARSNFDVLEKLGAQIAICGPADLLPETSQLGTPNHRFADLDEALGWCDVYMGLRMQLERHDGSLAGANAEFHSKFGLNEARLRQLNKEAIIMHPGPINHGVEFSSEVMMDSRSRVLHQVSNGVLIRSALLERAFQQTEVVRDV